MWVQSHDLTKKNVRETQREKEPEVEYNKDENGRTGSSETSKGTPKNHKFQAEI